jgi:hypothetical protein
MNKERITYLAAILILLVALAITVKQCSSNALQLKVANQNAEALIDTTRKVKNLLGREQYERKILMGDIQTLKKINTDLTKEIEQQRGNVRVVTKVVTKVVFDTIIIDNRVDIIDDSTYSISFKYLKNYDSLNSISFNGSVPAVVSLDGDNIVLRSKTTRITDLSMNMKLYTGIREEEGIYSIFAKTDFPGVTFDLDGAVVDPDKSFVKPSSGPFSFMVGGGIGYGITPNGPGFFPSVGLYVGINLFNF